MSLLFMDGFDYYVTADITKKWSRDGGGAEIRAGGRNSSGSFGDASGGATSNIGKSIPAGASFVVGFAYKFTGSPSGTFNLISMYDAATIQCELRMNVSGALIVTRNGSALSGGTSATGVITQDVYAHIEWKFTIANSIGAGTCVVKVNGSTVITVDTGQDLQNTANASASYFYIGPLNAPGHGFDYDDFYICDQNGSVNNDFLGDCRIDTLLPTGDGANVDFTKSAGSTHWELVDEVAPNTTDYVYSSTSAHRDSYTYPDLETLVSSAVHAVQVNAAALKLASGARQLAPMIRIGSTNYDGTGVPLVTDQIYIRDIFEYNPGSGSPLAAWTDSAVDGAEFGVVISA